MRTQPAWLPGRDRPRRRGQITAAHIARVHAASRRRYGSPRVTAQLAREGITVNHKAVEREIARQGLAGRCSRRKIRTTRRDPAQVPAADLVRRDFARPRTDELWIGDATYIWTDKGWCYLATVVDACSRRLPGWSITDHLRTELCLDALLAGGRGPRRTAEPPGRDHFSHRSRQRRADSTGRRNTSITEVCDGTRQEAVAGAAGGCAAAVGGGSGVAAADAFAGPA